MEDTKMKLADCKSSLDAAYLLVCALRDAAATPSL